MSKAGAKATAEAKLKALPEDDELAEQFYQQLFERVQGKTTEIHKIAPSVLRNPDAGRLDYFMNFLMQEGILTRRQLLQFEVTYLQQLEVELDAAAEQITAALKEQEKQARKKNLQVAKKPNVILGPHGEIIGGGDSGKT